VENEADLMAFISEKVSKEEVAKYSLDELWNYYHMGAYIELPDICFEHFWTIDREKEIWLYDMDNYKYAWGTYVFILYYNNKKIEITIKEDENNSTKLSDIPFIKNLDLISIDLKSKDNFDLEEIKSILKEGLVKHYTSRFFRIKPNHPNYILNCRW